MRPYHPQNMKLISHPAWRVVVLAWVGKLLGVHFHIEGIPFGAAYRGTVGGNPFNGLATGNMENRND